MLMKEGGDHCLGKSDSKGLERQRLCDESSGVQKWEDYITSLLSLTPTYEDLSLTPKTRTVDVSELEGICHASADLCWGKSSVGEFIY